MREDGRVLAGILVASGQAPCGIFRSVLDESLSTQGRPSLHSVLHPSAAVLERASPNHRNYIFLLNELCLQAISAEAADNHRRHCVNQVGARTERPEWVLVSWDAFHLVTLCSCFYTFVSTFWAPVVCKPYARFCSFFKVSLGPWSVSWLELVPAFHKLLLTS